MKTLLIAMASDRVAPDVRVEEANRQLQLWTEGKFSLMRTYEGRGLFGEKYLLTNISNEIMVLAEQEFDRADGTVLGVAIENLNLRPGESTSIYVIRIGS
jgi:conjugal transfer pilus assembly protein TraK